MLGKQNKAEVRQVFLTQWFVSAAVVFFMLIVVGQAAAMSALYGSTVSLLPAAFFGYMVFRYQGVKQLRQIIYSFYLGEALKLLLSAGIFAIYLCFFSPIWSVFIVSFLLVHASFCFAPLAYSLRH